MSAEPMKGAFADAQPLTYRPAPRGGGDREALVKRYLPQVRRIAWHVHGSMSTIVDVEDLVQIGLIALVEAAASAQEQGAAFGAYLTTRLRGAMIDELRRQATSTRGAMRRRRQVTAAIAALTGPTGRSPTEAELAAHLGVTIEVYRASYATAEAVRFEPIDDVYADDLPWFADDSPDAFEQLAESDLRDTLIAAIGALPEREAQVIQLYHVEELNLEEIGLVLGVGSARVCQIKAAAHAKLKKALAKRV